MQKLVNNYEEMDESYLDYLTDNTEIIQLYPVNEHWLEFHPMDIQRAPKALREDKKIIMIVVSEQGLALEYASDALKNDKDVVRTAVSQDGYALQYASEKLMEDEDIYLASMNFQGQPFHLQSIPNNILLKWNTNPLPKVTRQSIYEIISQSEENLLVLAKAKKHFLFDHEE